MLPEEETKLCPFCREIIRASAIKCRFCGEWLEESSTSADPITAVRRALASKYKIVYQLGHGGMSVLYRASEITTERDVALKVLPLHLSEEREYVGRFHREAAALSKLNHPNIIKIFEEGIENGVHFMAMEFLEGRDLHKLLMARGPISVDETARIIAPVAKALDYAHKNTLVHRDVKSSNIFITKEGRPVLTDFGIAHITTNENQLTVTGTVIGTPEFMSPEQAEGKPIDGRTDLYSLGVVMYNAITGRFPYHGDSPLTTIYKIINESHTPVNEVKELPEWMTFAIESCLEKDPDRRIKSGNELADILTRRKIPEGELTKNLTLETIRLRKEDMDEVLNENPEAQAEEETPEAPQGSNGKGGIFMDLEEEEPKKKKAVVPAPLIAAFLVLVAAIGYTVYNRYSENLPGIEPEKNTTTVTTEPENKTVTEPEDPLKTENKSNLTNKAEDNTGAPIAEKRNTPVRNNVVKTTPPAVQRTAVTVPNLEGMTTQEASRVLRRLGLRSGAVTRITSTASNYNLVLRQIPKPGRRLNEGSAVNLIVGE
ncbi:MAG: protein kinase [Ignavibacteria bacterium]|jgi:serine/threonine protein kinase|nr:protein kinase [Ignavibacteria bacterium]